MFPDEVRQPAGLLHRTSWFKSMSGSHQFQRTRGSQRSRLIWDQEKPGATPGCPTIFITNRQIAQTDEQRAEDATRPVQFQLWRPFPDWSADL